MDIDDFLHGPKDDDVQLTTPPIPYNFNSEDSIYATMASRAKGISRDLVTNAEEISVSCPFLQTDHLADISTHLSGSTSKDNATC